MARRLGETVKKLCDPYASRSDLAAECNTRDTDLRNAETGKIAISAWALCRLLQHASMKDLGPRR